MPAGNFIRKTAKETLGFDSFDDYLATGKEAASQDNYVASVDVWRNAIANNLGYKTMDDTTNELMARSMEIDERNYELQKEQQEYERELQKTVFEREDTAYQRKVDDLKQAGLNTQLALGAGASSGAIITSSAPQHSTAGVNAAIQAQLSKSSQELQKQAMYQDLLKNQQGLEIQSMLAESQVNSAQAEIALKNAQRSKTEAEEASIRNATAFETERNPLYLEQLMENIRHTAKLTQKEQADIARIIADTILKGSQNDLTQQKAYTEVENRDLIAAKANLEKLHYTITQDDHSFNKAMYQLRLDLEQGKIDQTELDNQLKIIKAQEMNEDVKNKRIQNMLLEFSNDNKIPREIRDWIDTILKSAGNAASLIMAGRY